MDTPCATFLPNYRLARSQRRGGNSAISARHRRRWLRAKRPKSMQHRKKPLVGSVPPIRIMRCVAADLEGLADHLAAIGQRTEQAQTDRLQQDITDGGGFHRAGQDWAIARISR